MPHASVCRDTVSETHHAWRTCHLQYSSIDAANVDNVRHLLTSPTALTPLLASTLAPRSARVCTISPKPCMAATCIGANPSCAHTFMPLTFPYLGISRATSRKPMMTPVSVVNVITQGTARGMPVSGHPGRHSQSEAGAEAWLHHAPSPLFAAHVLPAPAPGQIQTNFPQFCTSLCSHTELRSSLRTCSDRCVRKWRHCGAGRRKMLS